jgi:hypothetical protein
LCLPAVIGTCLSMVLSIAAPAQQLREVVIPSTGESAIELKTNSAGQGAISIDSAGFDGTVRQFSAGQTSVMLVRPRASSPAVLTIKQGGSVAEKIRLLPVAVSVEESVIKSSISAPDPLSRDYTNFTQKSEPFGSLFNGAQKQNLRDIKISGHEVLIQPGTKQGIYERVMPGGSPALDVRAIDIYAKNVVIAAPLELPGTTVRIYAESLEFRDSGAKLSYINTTPVVAPANTIPGKGGIPGEKAGDVYLYIRNPVVSSNTAAIRFMLRGGAGQQGGPEQQGASGTSRPEMPREPQIGGIQRDWGRIPTVIHGTLPPEWGSNYDATGRVIWFKRGGNFEFGSDGALTTDGGPGVPGGAPGVGGQGGTLHTRNVASPSVVDVSGGQAGTPRPKAPGGDPGTPNPAIGIWIDYHRECGIRPGATMFPGMPPQFGMLGSPVGCWDVGTGYNFYVYNTHRGAETPAPTASKGPDGAINADLTGWRHPSAIQASLGYAEDLYRIGLSAAASDELTWLATTLSDASNETGSSTEYAIVVQRVNTLLARISSNQDYFGNPAGWVPSLDLSTTITLLKAEVAAAAPILTVIEQVRQQAEQASVKATAFSNARASALQSIADLEKRLDDLAHLAPALTRQISEIGDLETQYEADVRAREVQLRQQATDNTQSSFFSKALKTLGALAKVFPIGQPVVGSIGAGLTLVGGIGDNTPWETIQGIPSVAQGFSPDAIAQSVQNYHNMLDSAKRLDLAHPVQLTSQISGTAQAIGNSLAQFRKLQEASRAPANEVEAELQKLRQQDSAYNDLVDKASQLLAKKRVVGQALDNAVREMAEVTSQLSIQADRVDALTRSIVINQDTIDHPAVVAATGISRSIHANLDYYHYLLIKAYEYYTASAYPGSRRAAKTADDLADYLKNSGIATSASDTYRAAFTAEEEALARNIIDKLIQRGSGSQKTVNFVLGTEDLKYLERMLAADQTASEELFINLEDRGLLLVNEEEVKLTNVTIASCDCKKNEGNPGSATIQIDVRPAQSGTVRTPSSNLRFRMEKPPQPWGATIDLTSSPVGIRPIVAPEDTARVLATFLGMTLPSNNVYSSPPAAPGIYVRARPLVDPAIGFFNASVKGLSMTLTYAYRPGTNVVGIRVVSSGTSGQPLFFVSDQDSRGLQHGMGSFTRSYRSQRAAPVEVVAQHKVGNDVFQGWYLNGILVQNGERLRVPSEAGSYAVEARYSR